MEPSIKEQYLNFLLEHGKRPASVFKFMKNLGQQEADFYKEYNSFDALEAVVFKGYFEEVMTDLKADETYQSYPSRQKLAAIYYTWFEKLKLQRSLVSIMDNSGNRGMWGPAYLEGTEESFKNEVNAILIDGIDAGDIADRWFVNQLYPGILWNQAKFLLGLWIYDNSKDFSATDASIEKLVRFTFDLIEPNLIDSGWDLLVYTFKRK
ncbi:MAG: TetR/AcrR family transcriptional regulator [Bacteroidia bacterium]|nr:TetR/AcrR family transcriptional regulator [Bacteroidia bacterium]